MDYYDWDLNKRKLFLGAHHEDYLCKSLIVENTKFEEGHSDPYYSRYYIVIVQYTTTYMSHKLFKFLKNATNNKFSKSQFNFRFADPEEAFALSGFDHNAITPFGMKVKMPIVLSDKIAQLKEGYFWLGGGDVDLKLKIDVSEFIDKCKPYVVDIIQDTK
eukprot:TRINITY_DN3393_c0_g1_i1.p1 TRINITY_DN3393_c0_g1~~TRINITY_DN3393_c0_g1_i1.p1  ORF type:complete len:160 (+),score=38.94 TRINITY_DN3393_c0_g1_i1:446-925(+)